MGSHQFIKSIRGLSTQPFRLRCVHREKSAMNEAMMLLSQPAANLALVPEKMSAQERSAALALLFRSIKLAGRGMCALQAVPERWTQAQRADLGQILVRLAIGAQKQARSDPAHKPRFLRRVVPFCTTCRPSVSDVEEAAASLARQTAAWEPAAWCDGAAPALPENGQRGFAVAFRPRQATAVSGGEAGAAQGSEAPKRLEIVAAAAKGLEAGMKARAPTTTLAVDLIHPHFVLVVEQLPLGTESHLGLSLLPGSACAVKPRLAVKGLCESS